MHTAISTEVSKTLVPDYNKFVAPEDELCQSRSQSVGGEEEEGLGYRHPHVAHPWGSCNGVLHKAAFVSCNACVCRWGSCVGDFAKVLLLGSGIVKEQLNVRMKASLKGSYGVVHQDWVHDLHGRNMMT
eukprot:scaffold102979_cov20-Tisochrysis_lutea.AAC.1